MDSTHFDLIVIGSGSAASAGWFYAVELRKRVAVFEEDVLGGECPTFACVPTKALLHCAEVYQTVLSAHEFGIDPGNVSFDYQRIKERKDLVVSRTGAAQGLKPYEEAGVEVVRSRVEFVSPGEVEAAGKRYSAERFLVATGTRVRMPEIRGLAEAGFLTFKEAIDLTSLPKSVFILGGGPVGCEFAQLFSSFGVQVTIADHNAHLLAREDPEVGHFLAEQFAARGVRVLTEAEVSHVERRASARGVRLKQGEREETIVVEELLVATGKTPNVEIRLEAAGIDYDDKGIKVDENLRTSNERVYAAGDVAGPYRFTHAASYQGQLAVRNAFSARPLAVDYRAMPRCVFTSPEVATVGMTEREAREKGIEPRVGTADLNSLTRANTTEGFAGFVKVIADANGVLLGAAVVAPRAGEMAHELALAIALGARAERVAAAVHAFPTFSEAISAACAAVQ